MYDRGSELVASGTLWSRIVSHLFFLFFTSPILSPAINERTLYLYWLIPAFDPQFLSYLSGLARRTSAHAIVASAALLIWFGITDSILALRWLLILWPLAYLQFTHENSIFYLYWWTGFNIAVAMVQAVAYLSGGPAIAFIIGPSNIAKFLWGHYATLAYTNFYSIVPGFDFPRFSGLSREGGFFAALLAVVVLLKKSLQQPIGALLLLGIGLSLSKSTVFLGLGWLAVLAALRDRRTPTALFFPFLLVFSLAYYLFVDDALMSGEVSTTFTHRLYAYAALFHDMDINNLMFGKHASLVALEQFRSFQVCARKVSGNLGPAFCREMPSFAALVFDVGLVGLALYLWQLAVMGIKLWGVILIFVLTSNVFPLSETSFVVLSYFLALKLGRIPGELVRNRLPAPSSMYGVPG